MKKFTYGLGGYDKTKPNNNLIEEYDDGIEDLPDLPPEPEEEN